MKKQLFLIFCIGISLAGCNQEESINLTKEEQTEASHEKPSEKIIVKERQGDEFTSLKELVNSDEIKTVVEIIKKSEWEENIMVSMEHPPDYRFIWESVNYALWITPNRDRLEIVAEGQSKYIKLPIKDSENLYKILTGKEL
ncbi:hypothetical protein [Ureibacillus aquaedulcis]|uniref:Lipoprotein n=1 Tax=Ureibacillus aquaedulcis TaxID=3058421 RepID=A0ABT8GMH3_9BACL|nr:hypothetical protein [Ureibacillus sp. BA0131]MDN4492613.1 hypothetical protein [Ureibacillus sp. BA0131]